MFSLICVWINDWVKNREAGDLRRYRAHYDVMVMKAQWAHGWIQEIIILWLSDLSIQNILSYLDHKLIRDAMRLEKSD